jgi:hypothetical protein
MSDNQVVQSIQDKYDSLKPYLNEKTRRIWAAIEARSLGWGGVSQVAIATGLSRTTIHTGIRLLLEASSEETSNGDSHRIRSSGAGRKLLEEKDAMLLSDLESLGYSLQSNRKTSDGSSCVDRDDQFLHTALSR